MFDEHRRRQPQDLPWTLATTNGHSRPCESPIADTRSQFAQSRDEAAAARDRMADGRDAAARARDRNAAALDAELDQVAVLRAHAAVQRDAAARDRELAAEDRRQAARDRAEAAAELALEGLDHLTGALRRNVGQRAIRRELDRTTRTGEALVVAYVDVDGLKLVNDTRGHGAGDDLLRLVASTIEDQLRSYDVIARFGGDEFVCSLAGQSERGARERFRRISALLREQQGRPTISLGLAERRSGDTVEELVARADAALLEARRSAQR
jgi:diguanylate cyclase (GGDEF)-like protein